MKKIKGLFRYLTFGLRTEWVKLFFEIGIDAVISSSLGPKQKEALYRYLQDAELIINKQKRTPFHDKIVYLYRKEGSNSENLWSFLWINLCFHASLFKWWGTQGKGEYSRERTIDLLSQAYGKKNSSIVGAYISLISTFERTPIGTALKIGKVIKEGRSRIIIKEGGYHFDPLLVLYGLYKYAEHFANYQIALESIFDSPYSPQKILALSSEEVKQSLLSLFEPEYLTVNVHDETVIFLLNEHKSSLDVLDLSP